jgi:hypothetical protein
LLVAVLLCALALAPPADRAALRPIAETPAGAADLVAGHMPTFQSGDTLPVDGVFALVLQPVASVIYPAGFEHAAEGGCGGVVTKENVPAGRYRIVFFPPVREDAGQHHALLASQDSASRTRCSINPRVVEVAPRQGRSPFRSAGHAHL